jgi:aspartate aminotransferase
VSPEQVDELAEHAHVYMTRDGRISMAGLNENNLKVGWISHQFAWNFRMFVIADHQYFAESMSKVVKGELKPKSSL